MWLPDVEAVASSSTFYGYYSLANDTSTFSGLYASPQASSATTDAYLLPMGGLVSRDGVGGVGELPRASYSQGKRAVEWHALLVQTGGFGIPPPKMLVAEKPKATHLSIRNVRVFDRIRSAPEGLHSLLACHVPRQRALLDAQLCVEHVEMPPQFGSPLLLVTSHEPGRCLTRPHICTEVVDEAVELPCTLEDRQLIGRGVGPA